MLLTERKTLGVVVVSEGVSTPRESTFATNFDAQDPLPAALD
jgi:hypothetical protein